MIDRLKDIFDVIILDGTPAMLVTDALILSRIVDTTLIVASHKSTKKDDLEKIKKSIENVGGKIAGVVLNRKPLKAKKYSTSYYYWNSSNSNNRHGKKDNYSTESSISKEKQEEILSQLNNYIKNKD